MLGYGSGRSTGSGTCEGCKNFDLAWLRRRGMLTPGRYSTPNCSLGGDQIGSITLAAQQDGVRLLYHTKNANSAPIDVNELVPFAYTPTRFRSEEHTSELQSLRHLVCRL